MRKNKLWLILASKKTGSGRIYRSSTPLPRLCRQRSVEDEAERVRFIFRRYLEVSGINELVRDLKAKSIRTKARTLSTTGKIRGGIAFGTMTTATALFSRRSGVPHTVRAPLARAWGSPGKSDIEGSR